MGFLKNITKLYDKPLGEIFDPWSGRSQQEDANKMAMQAWNLANDYNSPAAQVARLEAAGLNKYLVNLSGNTAGVPGLTGGTVNTGFQSAFSGLRDVMSAVQGQANIDNTRAQTQASTAAAGASAAQANNLEAQTTINQKKADYEEKNLIADLDYKKAQTQLARQQAKKVSAEADITQGEADIFGSIGGSKVASSVGSGLRSVLKAVRGVVK
ncbi:MAG: DNA pilot protein [Microviridae sp.]|nr:MAG: DNA pilot protein [Microviridae sp.]